MNNTNQSVILIFFVLPIYLPVCIHHYDKRHCLVSGIILENILRMKNNYLHQGHIAAPNTYNNSIIKAKFVPTTIDPAIE